MLCFNHNANFTLVTGTISEGSVTLQQTDESGTVRTLDPSQYNITDSQTGTIAITDFSPQPTSDYVIWPNLSATIPITTNLGDNNPANTSTSINSDSSGSGLLAWCSVAIPRGKLATNNTRAVPGALHEFGSYLYFANGVLTGDSNQVSQLSSVASDSGGANPNPNVIDSIELNSSTFLDGSLAASGIIGDWSRHRRHCRHGLHRHRRRRQQPAYRIRPRRQPHVGARFHHPASAGLGYHQPNYSRDNCRHHQRLA